MKAVNTQGHVCTVREHVCAWRKRSEEAQSGTGKIGNQQSPTAIALWYFAVEEFPICHMLVIKNLIRNFLCTCGPGHRVCNPSIQFPNKLLGDRIMMIVSLSVSELLIMVFFFRSHFDFNSHDNPVKQLIKNYYLKEPNPFYLSKFPLGDSFHSVSQVPSPLSYACLQLPRVYAELCIFLTTPCFI